MLLVYTFHVDRFVSGYWPIDVWPPYAFVRAGHTGVSLFFVLSGFLLSLPFIDGVRRDRPIRSLRFYERRVLRILPLYYTAVILGTVFCAQRISDLLHGLPYLFFLNAVADWSTRLDNFSNVWWSLATEAQFYLVLPLLPLCLRSRLGRWLALGVLLAYAAAYVAFLRGHLRMATAGGQFMLSLSLFGRGPMFLVGIAVAAIYVHAGPRIRASMQARPWLRRGGADAILLLMFAYLGFLLQWQVRVTHAVSERVPVFAWHVLEAVSWASILGLVLLMPLRSRLLWCSPILGHLGVLSYSMYMWHIPVVRFGLIYLQKIGIQGGVGWTAYNTAILAGLTVVCVAVSELTYRVIERPFLRRKARLT